ncbi:MAG: hypothetical protein IKO78_03470 [Bacilli bacterium]|nr:hypothetical protein [Bacilli bacterium]
MVFEEKDILTTRDDHDFRSSCVSYGINIYDFILCDDAAVLKSPREGFYIFLDRNSYSTMGIRNIPANSTDVDFDKDSSTFKNLFSTISQDMGMALPYPFQNMSLKQLTDLANRVEVVDRNHGHSYDLIVNEKRVSDSIDDDSILLGAAKYIAVKANEYWHNTYKSMLLGEQEEPGVKGVYRHLANIMHNLNEYVDLCIKNGVAPRISDAAAYIGCSYKEIDIYASELYCLLRVLLRSKGYDFKTFDLIEKIPEDKGKDFDVRSTKLLSILSIPKSEVQERTRNLDKGLYRHSGSLKEFFEAQVAKNAPKKSNRVKTIPKLSNAKAKEKMGH